MSGLSRYAFIAAVIEALALFPAHASPNCLKDQKAYQLTGDFIGWSMAIAPGANCIQGLRWSYMQVYAVWVLEKPAHGELVTVGSGFRYSANPDSSGTDKFTLVVVGKNRHQEGYSTVEINVSRPEAHEAIRPTSHTGDKVADAAAR